MDRDTALRLAIEAKLVSEWGKEYPSRWQSGHDLAPYVERFAALVAAHEREACAKVCEQTNDGTPYNLAAECAAAIRSRT